MSLTNKNKNMKRILFVEDNLEQLKVLGNVQPEFSNCQIDVATTFREYEALASAHDYDLVITDLFFPYGGSDAEISARRAREFFTSVYNGVRKYAGLEPTSERIFKNWKLHDVPTDREYPLEQVYFCCATQEYSSDDRVLIFSVYDGDDWSRYSAGRLSELKRYLGEGEEYDVAPFGVQVFWEMFYVKNVSVKMVTSDHCHDSEGALALGFLQQQGVLLEGRLPYESVRGADPRLTTDLEKPYSEENMIRIIEEGLGLIK